MYSLFAPKSGRFVWEDASHPLFRFGQRLKLTIATIQFLRILGGEQQAAHVLQVGMIHNRFDQPFAQTTTAVRFNDEHVANPAEEGIIGDNPRETDLPFAFVDTKTERIIDRFSHHLDRAALRPIGSMREKIEDHLQVQLPPIRADQEILPSIFDNGHASNLNSRPKPVNRILAAAPMLLLDKKMKDFL